MTTKLMSTRKLSLICAASAALLAAACSTSSAKKSSSSGEVSSSGGPRPAWVDGKSAEFPRERYVTGVASADDDGSASDRARGEIARVFSADVQVLSTVNESESNSTNGGKESHSFSNEVAQKVRTAAQKVLEGVDIVARWKDPTGRCYALAVLPKDQALLAINEKSQEINNEATQYKAELASSSDRFGRAKAAAKLLALAKAQAGLAADLRVLGGGPLQGSSDLATTRKDAAQALAALDVTVSATGDDGRVIQTGIVSGLNAAGLSAKSAAADEKSDLVATAQVSVVEQESGDPRWKRFRSSATISLSDGRNGKVFSTFDVSIREDATDVNEARRRCVSSLSKKIAEKVTATINDFFADQ